MKERPTPETDAKLEETWQSVNVPTNPIPAEFARKLERERDEAREEGLEQARVLGMTSEWGANLIAERNEAQRWRILLSGWGGTPEIVHEFIKGQQARIHAVQDIERELEQAKQDTKQHEVDCLRALGERNEAREQRDKLAKAAKLIADEYEDRSCQFGSDPLWIKHEQGSAIENALAIINEHHHE